MIFIHFMHMPVSNSLHSIFLNFHKSMIYILVVHDICYTKIYVMEWHTNKISTMEWNIILFLVLDILPVAFHAPSVIYYCDVIVIYCCDVWSWLTLEIDQLLWE